jgi:hypothetical protein
MLKIWSFEHIVFCTNLLIINTIYETYFRHTYAYQKLILLQKMLTFDLFELMNLRSVSLIKFSN